MANGSKQHPVIHQKLNKLVELLNENSLRNLAIWVRNWNANHKPDDQVK